jgi:RNA 2',3'-cyclic 3'-phosphodiesterase
MNTRRFFLGIPVSADARHAIQNILKTEFVSGLPGKPVNPDKWHITLVFLGEVDTARSEDLARALGERISKGVFDLTLQGFGCFPDPAHARVLWLGIQRNSKALHELAGDLRQIVRGQRITFDEATYHPHLTLSRLPKTQDLTHVCERPRLPEIPLAVDRFHLYESLRSGTSTPYRILHTFKS